LNEKQGVDPFNNAQISGVNVLLDLVYWIGKHHCNMVKTFVNVFKKVFDTSNMGRHFNVNMCIKHLGKVKVVGHHPSFVVCKSIWSLSKRLTVVSLMVDRVTIFALCCLLGESSRITFIAYNVDHVGCVGLLLAA
jgi:hypothetical protein